MTTYPDFNELLLVKDWDWYTGEVFLSRWLGSILDLTQEENQRTSETIARNFQSCNKIAEVIDRHTDALNPSSLGIQNTLLSALMEKWARENSGIFGHPFREAALKAKVDGRSYLRLFFRKSYSAETKFESLEVHCPPKESIKAYRNNDNLLSGFDYHYKEDGINYTEKQFLREGKTVFQTIRRDSLTQTNFIEKEFEKDLGGGFTIVEINLKSLITKSIKQNQNGINFALTLLPHNLIYSGWVQETVMNAQPPGKWDFDDKGREVFKPDPPRPNSGAGITRFYQGLPINDEKNNLVGYTNPAIHVQQPVEAEMFLNTFRGFSVSIYEQVGQTFVLSADLVLSGISREQSREDFKDKVIADAVILSYVYSDLLTVSSYFLGANERINAKLTPKIDQGIEQKKLLLLAQAQGLVSKRTAVQLLGFASDVEAELAELQKEADEAIARIERTKAAAKTKPAAQTLE